MAITDAEYKCSCEYNTEWLLHALDHVNNTGHTMSMSGVVRPGVSRKVCPPLHETVPKIITDDFNHLRDLLDEVKGGSES